MRTACIEVVGISLLVLALGLMAAACAEPGGWW